MHFLGLDIGTSAVKAVLVDEQQAIVAYAATPLPMRQPRPGWFEQNPEDWWRASQSVVAELRGSSPAAFTDVCAIGLSGQMHGAILLNSADAVVRPAILWNDRRATSERAELTRAIANVATIAGVIPMPGFTAPKLIWLRANEPDSFARIGHVLLAKDFVRFRLTGEIATDPTDAAGTLLLDEATRDWSGPLLAAVGLQRDQLPPLVESAAPAGMLRAEIATAWGISHPVVVATGAGDVTVGAIGVGAIDDGDGFVSLGTSAQIFFARDRYVPRPATLIHAFAHALPGLWFEMAALLNGASCLDWVGRLLGAADIGALLAATEENFKGPSQVLFLPYLAGERTPLNDPEARGAFVHVDHATGATDLVQAVLEGVAFALADGQLAFGDGVRGAIPVIGGGAASSFWMKIVAAALDRPLLRVAGAENGPAFGATRLARMALTGEAASTVCSKPKVEETIAPDPGLAAAYAKRFTTFRAVYRSLRKVREATADSRPLAIR